MPSPVARSGAPPLAEASVTVRDVSAFWQAQPFDLELLTVNGRTLEGNCDLCFLKPRGQRLALQIVQWHIHGIAQHEGGVHRLAHARRRCGRRRLGGIQHGGRWIGGFLAAEKTEHETGRVWSRPILGGGHASGSERDRIYYE